MLRRGQKGNIRCIQGFYLLPECRSRGGSQQGDSGRGVGGYFGGGIPVTLKRGCSEYALEYPEYAQTGRDTAAMEYREEWRKFEVLADKAFASTIPDRVIGAHNSPKYAPLEARIMLVWLRYAATIGDLSYLRISGRPLTPFPGLERPPFRPLESDNSTG